MGTAAKAAVVEMLTIRPRPRASIPGRTAQGLLTRFEAILQGDEEALWLGHHLEAVLAKFSPDCLRRPPSENGQLR